MESAQCDFGVIRYGEGKADVHIDAPWGDKLVLKFDGNRVSCTSGGKLEITRESDNWKVTFNDSRHFTIPDAVINGG